LAPVLSLSRLETQFVALEARPAPLAVQSALVAGSGVGGPVSPGASSAGNEPSISPAQRSQSSSGDTGAGGRSLNGSARGAENADRASAVGLPQIQLDADVLLRNSSRQQLLADVTVLLDSLRRRQGDVAQTVQTLTRGLSQ